MNSTRQAIRSELQENNNAFIQERKKLITKGYFKIEQLDSKCTLKLKGDFNRNNIDFVNTSMKMTKSLRHRSFELDLNEVETITMQAMALLTINLKILKGNGTDTRVTGLDGEKLKLANELGMRFITQIN